MPQAHVIEVPEPGEVLTDMERAAFRVAEQFYGPERAFHITAWRYPEWQACYRAAVVAQLPA
jgi:hypothetical protein